jgi:hypothetical protein
MEIIELAGDDKRLYLLTAHLVMDEEVVAYNLNYPFKTSSAYRWFIAVGNGETLGFMPLKVGEGKAVINNYYVAQDDSAVFRALLGEVVRKIPAETEIESVTQTRHVKYFELSGFHIVLHWKRFVKMRAVGHGKERV